MIAVAIAVSSVAMVLASLTAWQCWRLVTLSRESADSTIAKRDAEDRYRAELQRAEDAAASLAIERAAGDLLRERVTQLELEVLDAKNARVNSATGGDLVTLGLGVLSETP